jgi:periplasmic protein TonB
MIPAGPTTRSEYRGPIAASRSVIGLAIGALHVAAIYALAHLNPASRIDEPSRTVEVMILSTAVADTPPPLPIVKLEDIRPEIEPPIWLNFEFDEPQKPTNAITLVSSVQQPSATMDSIGTPALVTQVEYLRPPSPQYPPVSKRLHEQGVVVLRVLIDIDGRALRVEVQESSGFERLDAEARNAVQRARFKPWTENGRARQAVVLVPIEFGLGNRTSTG